MHTSVQEAGLQKLLIKMKEESAYFLQQEYFINYQ